VPLESEHEIYWLTWELNPAPSDRPFQSVHTRHGTGSHFVTQRPSSVSAAEIHYVPARTVGNF